MTQTSAKVIADSISPLGVRLTTMEVCLHRFVLAELNTHRVFSRNSASSRAIPVEKQIERLLDGPAMPVEWPSEQKGMQGGPPLSPSATFQAQSTWDAAMRAAIRYVETLRSLHPGKERLHKSVVNRLLEPFMWHTVVITSTAWENFFALRLDPDAQPEIRVAAEAMKRAYDESTPRPLAEGEWHLPYVEAEDWKALTKLVPIGKSMYPEMTKISSARCARTSFLTQDGKRDVTEDLGLYDRLVTDRVDKGKGIHWSPLEHVATPWAANRQTSGLGVMGVDGKDLIINTDHLPRVGNLLGWRSLRTEVEAAHKARTFA